MLQDAWDDVLQDRAVGGAAERPQIAARFDGVSSGTEGCAEKRRVLVVDTHLRRDRSKRRSRDPLQSFAGLHVASLLDEARYEISLHIEYWHGPLDVLKPQRYDLVFLSGLQADFDRMRQLSFHFRRLGALVIAGGNLCSLFPDFCAEFFDVVCVGGVECVIEVLRDYESGRLDRIYRSPQERISRYRCNYSLLARSGVNLPIHLVEASRGCSFKCRFCVIPAEGLGHSTYELDVVCKAISDSIDASPWYSMRRLYPLIWFLDNNLSDNREYFVRLCEVLGANPKVRGWGALVTQNVLRDRPLLMLLAKNKCCALFTGLESLDQEFLRRHNKKQNYSRSASVVDDVLFAERIGICIMYAYLFDPRLSTIAEMRRQVAGLASVKGLPVPAFFSMMIPLLGTETFWESVELGELAPNLRVRDLDGETICYRKTADVAERVGEIVEELNTRPGRLWGRWRLIRAIVDRIANARPTSLAQLFLILSTSLRPLVYGMHYDRKAGRRYLAGVDALDPQYSEHPCDISSEDWDLYFRPVMVTDEHGKLAPWLEHYARLRKQRLSRRSESINCSEG